MSVSYYFSRSNTLTVSRTLMGHVALLTKVRVSSYLNEAIQAAIITEQHIESGFLAGREDEKEYDADLRPEFRAIELYFFDFLSTHKRVAMLNYGDEDGSFIMVKRMPDGSLATKTITYDAEKRRVVTWKHRKKGAKLEEILESKENPSDAYDPTGRPWYLGARESGGLFWSNAYVFWSDKRPGITVSIPRLKTRDKDSGSTLPDGTKIQGVFSVDIDIIEFSDFLKSLDVTLGGRVVILDMQEMIVASPNPEDLVVERKNEDGTKEFVLQKAKESSMAEVAALTGLPEFQKIMESIREQSQKDNSLSGKKYNQHTTGMGHAHPTSIRYEIGDNTYNAVIQHIKLHPNRDWIIVVTIPEKELLAELQATNTRNAVISLIMIVLALAVSLFGTGLLSRSLKKLAKESVKIQSLDFETETNTNSHFREINEVLEAFQDMKTGLRGFRKYLPVDLVRVLLENRIEPFLGSEQQEVTIFFSDIAGFTTISETMTSMEMSKRLGTYLASMTACIEEREGTVVQYVGDAIMAFWGAPLNVDKHASKVCDAALACQNMLKKLWDDDFPVFKTRIGIHYASVNIGHFGSPERMYYGAIGDGVNLTARLESANKRYGTNIIISGQTLEQIGDDFEVRKLDVIALKGKTKACVLYELMGNKGKVDEMRLERARLYEEALAVYMDRDFEGAEEILSELFKQDPSDLASKQLLERARNYQQKPPPTLWSGVYLAQTK